MLFESITECMHACHQIKTTRTTAKNQAVVPSYAGDGDKNRHMHACMHVRARIRIRTVVYRRIRGAFFFALRAKMD